MTRDEAFTIIADALGPIPQQADTAHHIATALDALGLLHFAADPQRLDTRASATSDSPERSSHSAQPQTLTQQWASQRNR
jgi:hypothetical protein